MMFKNQKLNELQSDAAVSLASKSGTFDEISEVLILQAYRQGVRDLQSVVWLQDALGASVSILPDICNGLIDDNLVDGASLPLSQLKPQ
jgi:hypothetical protein